jgi:predicted HicB family RNase H-like nuclease
MHNMMEIGGHRAVIQFEPEIGLFRSEFVGLKGGADFYADSVEGSGRKEKRPFASFWRCAPRRASSR